MWSVSGVRVYGVAGLQKPGRKRHSVDMALHCSPSSFPVTKVAICHAWSTRALHLHPRNVTHRWYQQHCHSQVFPWGLQPKAVLTQFSTAEKIWEGQSWPAAVSDLPLLPLRRIILIVRKQVKIPPLSSESHLWPNHHHHLGNQTNKQKARKMLHNYSEPPWKKGCYQNHWVSFIEDFLVQ